MFRCVDILVDSRAPVQWARRLPSSTIEVMRLCSKLLVVRSGLASAISACACALPSHTGCGEPQKSADRGQRIPDSELPQDYLAHQSSWS